MSDIKYVIITVSDSRSRGHAIDKSAQVIENLIQDNTSDVGKILKGQIVFRIIIPDDESIIQKQLTSWSESGKVDVVLTTGGTGLSERDVTPEATRKVIDREIPGISLGMFMSSIQITPMAMLSRAVCGIKNKTIIINLPGSPKAVEECLTAVAPVISHAVDLIKNNMPNVTQVHKCMEGRGDSDACSQTVRRKNILHIENVSTRPRESVYPMILMEEAIKMIGASVEAHTSEIVPIWEAYGRILASDVYSMYDLPPFRASIKDGYAVLASDGKGRRHVLGGVKAGNSHISVSLQTGTCMRVNTGAPIPDGATAVVQVEDTKLLESSLDGKEEKAIEILTDVKEGQDIRPIGCDIRKGELIVKQGTKLGAVELGLLEACGLTEVFVITLPKIGVLSTGDELQRTGEELLPGHVYDSNKITLLSVLKEQGLGLRAVDVGIAQDEENDMVEKITHALNEVDVLITTGSVSMGDRDMLKPVLQHHFKATIHFGRVNMKPGKPTTFATCTFNGKKKYLLCLPGNPVSATVTMHLFVSPLLKELCGDVSKPIMVKAMLTSSYKLDPRPEYARAILRWDDASPFPKAYTTGVQASSKLLSCKTANAFIILPARTTTKTECSEGEIVQAMLLGISQYD